MILAAVVKLLIIQYTLHLVLITALIVIISFVRVHSKQYHAIRSCEYFAVTKSFIKLAT